MLLKITLLLIVISIAMEIVWNAYYRTLSDVRKFLISYGRSYKTEHHWKCRDCGKIIR